VEWKEACSGWGAGGVEWKEVGRRRGVEGGGKEAWSGRMEVEIVSKQEP